MTKSCENVWFFFLSRNPLFYWLISPDCWHEGPLSWRCDSKLFSWHGCGRLETVIRLFELHHLLLTCNLSTPPVSPSYLKTEMLAAPPRLQLLTPCPSCRRLNISTSTNKGQDFENRQLVFLLETDVTPSTRGALTRSRNRN